MTLKLILDLYQILEAIGPPTSWPGIINFYLSIVVIVRFVFRERADKYWCSIESILAVCRILFIIKKNTNLDDSL